MSAASFACKGDALEDQPFERIAHVDRRVLLALAIGAVEYFLDRGDASGVAFADLGNLDQRSNHLGPVLQSEHLDLGRHAIGCARYAPAGLGNAFRATTRSHPYFFLLLNCWSVAPNSQAPHF